MVTLNSSLKLEIKEKICENLLSENLEIVNLITSKKSLLKLML